MLISLAANKPTFQKIEFNEGFNVILAEITDASDEKDSRNGLGKSTLIDIIHFCLGSDIRSDSTLSSDELSDWKFILELKLDKNRIVEAIRSIDDPSSLIIKGKINDWLDLEARLDHTYTISNNKWKELLAKKLFNLETEDTSDSYTPSFRSIFAYYSRRGLGAYENPFKYFSNQTAWQKQIYNSFLLNLNWNYARKFQLIKKRRNELNEISNFKDRDIYSNILGSEGELESLKVTLENEANDLEEQLSDFKVHPEYQEIQDEADMLTNKIHDVINDRNTNKKLLQSYQSSLKEESIKDLDKVKDLYSKFGVTFSESTTKSLQQVIDFHTSLISNRNEYLENEIQRLEEKISSQSDEIETLSDNRADKLDILESHGALDEYSSLQNRLTKKREELEEVKSRLEVLDRIENEKINLDIETKELVLNTRQDLQERREQLDKVITLFNQCSQFLYSDPGNLSVNINDSGYKFNVDIQRESSQGIERMKIFSYDFSFLEFGYTNLNRIELLIHDSTIFDGVDERQIAKAIEYAISKCEELNTQYICTLNSDLVPYHLFSDEVEAEFKEGIILTLKDDVPENSLLGIRF